MSMGEDEIRSAANGTEASQGTAVGPDASAGDAAARCDRASGELSSDLPMRGAPERAHGDAGAKRKGIAAIDRLKLITAKPIAFFAGERISGPSNKSEAAVHARSRRRVAPLAATIALAAGAGAFLGALSAGGFVHQLPESAAVTRTAQGHDATASMKAQLAEMTALKASLDRANRAANAQFTKMGQKLDSLEQAQAGPTAKLAQMADALDRLEKQLAAAPEVTGSIASNARSKTSEPSVSAPVLSSWIVDDVRNGRAMVESRYGGVFVVGAGSVLPGLGRVEQIERQDGRWVVVTASGLITSPR